MPIRYIASPGAAAGSGAPDNAQYVTLATDATLTNERVLTAGDGIDLADAGAGSTITIATDIKANGGIVIEATELAVDLGASSITGTLAVADGGTGVATFTDAGVLIGNVAGAIQVTTAGTVGQILTSNGAGVDPTFQAAAGGGAPTTAQYVVLSLDATLSAERVLTAGDGLDLTDGGANGNATLLLDLKANGGLVIESTEAAVDLGASSITGTLAVGDGGTGATGLTDGGIILGSGSAAVTVTAQPTNGQLLIGTTGSDPVLAILTDGAGITITEGAGTITIASTLGTSVDLTSEVTGTLPVGNGGTNVTTHTQDEILTGAGSGSITTQATSDENFILANHIFT